ncbi:hypothetical protein pb186bvf_011900 [Paramecium bursaria]
MTIVIFRIPARVLNKQINSSPNINHYTNNEQYVLSQKLTNFIFLLYILS